MCGLFGWQYSDKHDLTDFQRTLIADILGREMTSRGRDSCGYATWVPEDNHVYFDKETGTWEDSPFRLTACQADNLIGHTRFATVGAKTKANAHPYHIGKIIGAHNGGIFNHHELSTKYKRNFDVDSMHLIAHLNAGISVEEMEGYGTVTWFDLNDPGAIYLCAMRRGDLEIEVLPNDAGIVWSSTRIGLGEALRPVKLWTTSKSFRATQGWVYRAFGGKIEKTDKRMELSADSWKTHNAITDSKRASRSKAYTYPYGGGAGFAGSSSSSSTSSSSSSSSDTTPPTDVPARTTEQPFEWFDFESNQWCKGNKEEYEAAGKAKPGKVSRHVPSKSASSAPTNRKKDDGEAEYRRAEEAYDKFVEKEKARGRVDTVGNGLTDRERKRFCRLINKTEHHRDQCPCIQCKELFRLAAMSGHP